MKCKRKYILRSKEEKKTDTEKSVMIYATISFIHNVFRCVVKRPIQIVVRLVYIMFSVSMTHLKKEG